MLNVSLGMDCNSVARDNHLRNFAHRGATLPFSLSERAEGRCLQSVVGAHDDLAEQRWKQYIEQAAA